MHVELIVIKSSLPATGDDRGMPAHDPVANIPLFDAALISRYDVSGPRYSSYPTTSQFNDAFDADAFRASALVSNEDPIPRELSIYVHVPSCLGPCYYRGCNRIIVRERRLAERYVDHLVRDIDQMSALFDHDRRVMQVHFGGVTPNFLDGAQLRRLMDVLHRHFDLSREPGREFGIALDARTATPQDIAMLAALGFNRLSIGIQDFDTDAQLAINRVQGIAETRALLDAAEHHGFRSTSVDLFYGVPLQTVERFTRTLELIVAMRPRRIVVRAYARFPPRFPAQRQSARHDLPDAATRLALLGLAVECLCAAGYLYIGMDHFALPDDDLAIAQREGSLQRNLQGYSTHAQTDLIGIGVSSISHVGTCFSQNRRDLAGYESAIDAAQLPIWRGLAMSDDDRIRADVIQQLMCRNEIDLRATSTKHGIVFEDYFVDSLRRLDPLVADGLVARSRSRITALPRGRLLLRTIAMCFDAYLGQPNANASPPFRTP